jgi:hypothetical protein
MTRREFEKDMQVILAATGSRERLHEVAIATPEWMQYYTKSYNFNLSKRCKLRAKK